MNELYRRTEVTFNEGLARERTEFVYIPVTIDYEAAANKVRELDTKTVPAWKIAKAVVDVALGGNDE